MATPGAAHALGLGEIRVDSSLNEPLSARIELVGATADDLRVLRAGIADPSIFQRYNADRPTYLSTVKFRLDVDAAGQPVLLLRSDSPFTDPLVEMLVDVRWGSGELVRDYSLLLDPAVMRQSPALAAPQPAAATAVPPLVPKSADAQASVSRPLATQHAASPAVPAQLVAAPPVATLPTAPQPVAAQAVAGLGTAHAAAPEGIASNAPAGYRVRPGDTLFAIVHRAGASTRDDVARMMISVFRGNPQAFDGNINQLRRDALLVVPALADVAGLDAAEAHREVAKQTRAWLSAAPWRNVAATRAVAAEEASPRPEPQPVAPVATEATAAPVAPVAPVAAATNESPAPVGSVAPGAPTEQPSPEAVAAAVVAAEPAPSLDNVAVPLPDASAATADEEPAPLPAPRAKGRWSHLGTYAGLAGLALVVLALLRRWRRVASGRADAQYEPAYLPAPQASGDTVPVRAVHRVPDESPSSSAIVVEEPTVEAATLTEAETIRLPAHEEGTTVMLQATQPMEDPGFGDTAEMTANLAAADEDEPLLEDTALMQAETGTVVLEGPRQDTATLEAGSIRESLAKSPATALDYNLLDLDAAAQHVNLPSDLNGRPNFVERRTSMVDALRMAISRDPSRSDLKLKLLETYYAQAASNLRAFADFVGLQGAEPAALTDSDWRRVEQMGRDLGLELEVPDTPKDDDLANCA